MSYMPRIKSARAVAAVAVAVASASAVLPPLSKSQIIYKMLKNARK